MQRLSQMQVHRECLDFCGGWRFTVSSAINMFYKQIILQQGIPFDVKLPKAPENSAKERLDAELEKGYNDMLKGRTRPAAMVLSDVKKKYKV